MCVTSLRYVLLVSDRPPIIILDPQIYTIIPKSTMMMFPRLAVAVFCCALLSVSAFVPSHVHVHARSSNAVLRASSADNDNVVENVKQTLQTSFRIFQESQQEGAGFKQIMANVLAGDYDQEQVTLKTNELINSAPCVMFTWKQSPSCKSAIQAMDVCGSDYTVVPLDDPWDKGNEIRAALGKMVGRTSVPSVFIGGQYVGGFDAGLNQDAPGLVELAFKGSLQAKLDAAGATKK
jgi:glutaredoxin